MTTESLRGRLLVATPVLGDPTFARTVVLVLDHGDDGALGVVLNRPSGTPVEEPLPGWDAIATEPGVVHLGGPVQPTAAIGLVSCPVEVEGVALLHGTIGTVDLDADPVELRPVLQALRVFAGYAGWSEGQLEGEIDEGAWFVVDARLEDAFTADPERLWSTVLARQPGELRFYASYPDDPTLN